MRITNRTIRNLGIIMGEILFIWSIIHVMNNPEPNDFAIVGLLLGGTINITGFFAICIGEIDVDITIPNPFKKDMSKDHIKRKIKSLKKEYPKANANRREHIIQEIVKLGDML
jgi:hypothetical protein